MNNNDLIRRGDVLQELDSFLAEVAEKMSLILEQYGACANRAVTNCEEISRGTVNNIRERINAIPAVEQPMNAVERVQRFCGWCARRWCDKCNLYGECHYLYGGGVKSPSARAFAKWAAEHPKEVHNEVD